MKWMALITAVATAAAATPPSAPTAENLLASVIDSDAFGFGNAQSDGRAVLKGKSGADSALAFHSESHRYDAPFAKSLIRFSEPAELAGAAFLQIQKRSGEDERFLYLPELKKSRRIAGNLRSGSFMGTDFSFADLDNGDLRSASVTVVGSDTIDQYPCWRLDAIPTRPDSDYSKLELWIRKDNSVSVQTKMYDKSKVLYKTLRIEELKRIGGRWFATRSLMTDHKNNHSTALRLEKIVPTEAIPDSEFTVRNLEKI